MLLPAIRSAYLVGAGDYGTALPIVLEIKSRSGPASRCQVRQVLGEAVSRPLTAAQPRRDAGTDQQPEHKRQRRNRCEAEREHHLCRQFMSAKPMPDLAKLGRLPRSRRRPHRNYAVAGAGSERYRVEQAHAGMVHVARWLRARHSGMAATWLALRLGLMGWALGG
jgi:hypothetical protein